MDRLSGAQPVILANVSAHTCKKTL